MMKEKQSEVKNVKKCTWRVNRKRFMNNTKERDSPEGDPVGENRGAYWE
jgi:hypothetical protein